MYEAAEIDGATRWSKIRFITLPLLKSTVITLTLMSIGRIFYSDFGPVSYTHLLAFPSTHGGVFASALEFLGIFAPTQLPLAVVEGILTVLIMMALENYAKPELKSIGFFKA